MKPRQINIDFRRMENAFREYVRKKAIDANSTIIYKKENQLIEEDPATSKKTVLKNL
ncbi:MAG: hypothetical protein SFU87_07505 [Chitinophagaceae bacterium]|nr:hypothetical protein [Chitinophagaceae bacterium]